MLLNPVPVLSLALTNHLLLIVCVLIVFVSCIEPICCYRRFCFAYFLLALFSFCAALWMFFRSFFSIKNKTFLALFRICHFVILVRSTFQYSWFLFLLLLFLLLLVGHLVVVVVIVLVQKLLCYNCLCIVFVGCLRWGRAVQGMVLTSLRCCRWVQFDSITICLLCCYCCCTFWLLCMFAWWFVWLFGGRRSHCCFIVVVAVVCCCILWLCCCCCSYCQ